jgi:hypothetical protein
LKSTEADILFGAEELKQKVKELGMDAVGISDHGRS